MDSSGVRLSKRSLIIIVAASVVASLTLIATVLLIWRPWQAANPVTESQRITRQVGQHFLLPEGEEPTVARIQDRSKLENQPFYSRAQNGDHVLIYEEAKIIILYRSSIKKVLNVGPINLDDQPSAPARETMNP